MNPNTRVVLDPRVVRSIDTTDDESRTIFFFFDEFQTGAITAVAKTKRFEISIFGRYFRRILSVKLERSMFSNVREVSPTDSPGSLRTDANI